MSKLLIVESPAKAKTIMKYLGEGYLVKASMGHLRDLPKKKIGVDIDNSFEPTYIPIDGKEKTIDELHRAANSAEIVYLATDPDREGEAISWHLKELLELDDAKTCRVTFNEITKKAVTEAVQNPRQIDKDLVDAQQARRILDRIVGYKLSPFLWKKVRKGLSAGRVQSVVTRLVVDREREISAFVPKEYWTIDAILSCRGKDFTARFHGTSKGKTELGSEEAAGKVVEAVKNGTFTVTSFKTSKKKRQPAPPFITSTLQQEASRKLGYASKRTMQLAQELYEGVDIGGTVTGLITYMRTDSLRISDEAAAAARDFITSRYGSEYKPSKTRVFKSKKSVQDAHEAIRPSVPSITPEQLKGKISPQLLKLYKLIWSRFIASQMSDAIFDSQTAQIENSGYVFRATGQSLAFPGYLALYEEGRDDETPGEDPALPYMEAGDTPTCKNILPKQHFTSPPPRYTEASLIKEMEEKGIGRPSTYAPTISVVIDREYVVKEDKALRPTALGEAVTDLMLDKFTDILDVAFTASMEDKLDEVEEGRMPYKQLLSDFYEGFSQNLAKAEADLDKTRIKVPDEKSGVICDLCGSEMVIKHGRFGRFLACPNYPECKNTKPLNQNEVTGVPCPVCGAKLMKKKSKRGFQYFGCEKNPTCAFMTWDKPTDAKCPKCGGVLYRHSTKEEKKLLCHVPGCGYEAELPKTERKTRKKAAEESDAAEPVKKTTRKASSKKQDAGE